MVWSPLDAGSVDCLSDFAMPQPIDLLMLAVAQNP